MQPEEIQAYLLLHNIRSAQNVGAIFRTAEAVGITKIFLTGYTPAPIDRFGRKRKDIAKSALGAEDIIDWVSVEDPMFVISDLKAEGFVVISIEQDRRAVDYKKFITPKKCCFIVGNEVDGIEKEILDASDTIIEIPMAGKKESLNVSVAIGVALFRVLNK
jgi:tRNA G18 (ribose-2'-O)-methylase SpoU